jgi:large subunit ribosomal protein L3
MYHRAPGSMGPIKGKMKGKKLPGHMGVEKVTVQNLKVVAVDTERQLLLISGSVPGPTKGYVVVKTSLKKGN